MDASSSSHPRHRPHCSSHPRQRCWSRSRLISAIRRLRRSRAVLTVRAASERQMLQPYPAYLFPSRSPIALDCAIYRCRQRTIGCSHYRTTKRRCITSVNSQRSLQALSSNHVTPSTYSTSSMCSGGRTSRHYYSHSTDGDSSHHTK